jgi:hypothetical protein
VCACMRETQKAVPTSLEKVILNNLERSLTVAFQIFFSKEKLWNMVGTGPGVLVVIWSQW